MKTQRNLSIGGIRLAAGALVAGCVALAASGSASASVTVFNNIPNPLAPGYPSLGYEATQTSQFGTEVNLAGGQGQTLSSASVTLVNWAGYNDSAIDSANGVSSTTEGYNWSGTSWGSNSVGYDVPLTLSFYNTNSSDPTLPGSLIGSVTQTVLVDWRPVATGYDTSGAYFTVNGTNYHGLAQTVTLDLSSAGISVPSTFIYTLGYNTQNYGASPTGTPGPYDSLNFGVVSGNPSVGSYNNPDNVFWNSTYPGGTGGELQQATGWTGDQPAASFAAVTTPLPGSGALAMIGGTVLIGGLALRRRMAKIH